ncbi:MAG: DUF4105 domain-containing protein [Myxococcota bacterium]
MYGPLVSCVLAVLHGLSLGMSAEPSHSADRPQNGSQSADSSPKTVGHNHKPTDDDREAALVAALNRAAERDTAEHPFWRRLLHYEPDGDSVRSLVDGSGFFLATDGARRSESELAATLEAFFADGPVAPYAMHTQCRFPARLQFLAKELELFKLGLKPQACPELVDFLKAIQPGRVYLVFAAAFLNAPASAFGHTLLRIENARHPGDALVSTMVNYAAYPTTYNPILYTVLGLIGGFPGRFAALPYYVKVQEYTNMQSRDLWEYELTLTPDETLRMLLHVWELDTSFFAYYFFTENCSYLLLRLLEIARPSLDLASKFETYAIPSDTLKEVVAAEGLVRRRTYRPAHAAVMNTRREELNGEEVDIAESLVTETPPWDALGRLEKQRQANVLEAAIDLHKYRSGFHPNSDNEYLGTELGQRELALVSARGALDLRLDTELEVPEPRAPEGSHGSARIGLGAGVNRAGRAYQTLSWRAALHDTLDEQTGYVRDSVVELAALRLRLEPQRFDDDSGRHNAVLLDRLDLVSITSILPWEGWVRKLSWRVNFGVGWIPDLNCRRWRCTALDLRGGPGLSTRVRWIGVQTFYAFAGVNTFAFGQLDDGIRFGVDGAAGTAWSLTRRLRAHVEAAYHYDFLGDTNAGADYLSIRGGLGLAFSPSASVRVEGRSIRDTRELVASVFAYY